jgi:hypothetical protein
MHRVASWSPLRWLSRRFCVGHRCIVAADLRCRISQFRGIALAKEKGRPESRRPVRRAATSGRTASGKIPRLEHSFASNLLAAGTDIVTVSKALGHANVHITLTTYAHAIPRVRQGAGDASARLMGQSGNKMETLTPETRSEVGQNIRQVVDFKDIGEVAERLNAPVLKTGIPLRGSRVRISPSPPIEAWVRQNRGSDFGRPEGRPKGEGRRPESISPSPPPIAHIPGAQCHILPTTLAQSSR